MKKLFLSFLLLGSMWISAQAQKGSSREWAAGLRLGDPAGLNVRKYFSSANALEINLGSTGTFYGGESRAYKYRGYGGYRSSGLALQVNYIWQKDIPSVNGLEWYWGLGGQVSSRRFYHVDLDYYTKNGKTYVRGGDYQTTAALGATGLIGIEWMIPDTPVSLFTDLGLYIEIVPAPFWLNLPLGVGGRFNF